jgi:hypothetical protein
MNAHRQHVCERTAARLVNGVRAGKVRLGTRNAFTRDLQVFIDQFNAKIGLYHLQDNVRVASASVLAGQSAVETCRLNGMPCLPRIEQHLFDSQAGLVVVQSVRVVQGGKILLSELVLREQ